MQCCDKCGHIFSNRSQLIVHLTQQCESALPNKVSDSKENKNVVSSDLLYSVIPKYVDNIDNQNVCIEDKYETINTDDDSTAIENLLMTGNENRIDDQNLCIEVQSEIINTDDDSTAIENLLMTGNENRIDDQNLCIEVQSEIINTDDDSTAIENLLMTGNENKIDESSETYLEIPVYSCTLIDGSEIAITECENISGDLMDTSTASTNNEFTQMISDSKGNNHVESSGILYSVIPKSVDNIDHQNVCIQDESENIFNTANESSAMENSLMVAENNDSFVIFDCRVKDPDWIPCEDDSDADNNQNIEEERTEEQANQNIEGDRTEEQANQNIEGDRTEEQADQNIEEEQDAAPVRRKRNRWMVADPSSWQRNLAKKKRNMGETYTVKRKGEVKQFNAKYPIHCDCEKCKFECRTFSEEDRNKICQSYWKLEDYERKKDFLLANVTCQEIKYHKVPEGGKARKDSKQYYFLKNGQRVRVCQNFFLKTLAISNGPLNNAFKHASDNGTFSASDMRGKHRPANKTSNESINFVKEHIESFPVTDAHYVRKTSSRKYLDKTLSISKMYELYKEKCSISNKNPVSKITYKRTFCLNYNYSFFKPRKDQCLLCNKFEAIRGQESSDENLILTKNYEEHRIREKEANQAKDEDKKRAAVDSSFTTATFDLQSVLQIPSTEASPMYYSRKLCCYNFTIYKGVKPNTAHCFSWMEIDGKRGSNEIATCLYLFLKNLPPTIKEVSLFSDTCGGQNRNQNVAAMMLNMVQQSDLEIITHKFLESGHSMMECDSMHSAIENQKKHRDVYTIHDWIGIFKAARSKMHNKNVEPYKTIQLKYTDFLNFSNISKSILRNKKVDIEGEHVNWLKIKCLKFTKADPNNIFFRYGHSGEYRQMNVIGRSRSKTNTNGKNNNGTLTPLYNSQLPISSAKYNDLVKLCKTGAIPKELHHWYSNLPHITHSGRDRNPEPEVGSDGDSDNLE